jgi:sec-independent protein translocase protein TatC
MAQEDSPMSTTDHAMPQMTLGEHLEELRWRLIYSFLGLAVGMGVALAFGEVLLDQLQRPYLTVMAHRGQPAPLQVLSAGKGFTIYLKVGFLGGLILTSPWVFYQLWMFVAAGLYPHERRPILLAVPFSALLFVAGAGFYLYVVAEPLMRFFLEFNDRLGWDTRLTLANHITMMVNMMLAFGVGFQLPIAMAILGRMGLVSSKGLAKYRRHMIVALLIFAAFVTSPSPFDQVLLAVPMYILFELGVLMVRAQERKQRSEIA